MLTKFQGVAVSAWLTRTLLSPLQGHHILSNLIITFRVFSILLDIDSNISPYFSRPITERNGRPFPCGPSKISPTLLSLRPLHRYIRELLAFSICLPFGVIYHSHKPTANNHTSLKGPAPTQIPAHQHESFVHSFTFYVCACVCVTFQRILWMNWNFSLSSSLSLPLAYLPFHWNLNVKVQTPILHEVSDWIWIHLFVKIWINQFPQCHSSSMNSIPWTGTASPQLQ